jgi:hypothetical protein
MGAYAAYIALFATPQPPGAVRLQLNPLADTAGLHRLLATLTRPESLLLVTPDWIMAA